MLGSLIAATGGSQLDPMLFATRPRAPIVDPADNTGDPELVRNLQKIFGKAEETAPGTAPNESTGSDKL